MFGSDSDDEFDQLRDRIESIEAELGIDHDGDGFALEGEVFLKLTDGAGSEVYVRPEDITSVVSNRPASTNKVQFNYEPDTLTSPDDPSKLRDAYADHWNTKEVELMSRAEVLDEVDL